MTIEQYKKRYPCIWHYRDRCPWGADRLLAEVVRLDPECQVHIQFWHHEDVEVPAKDVVGTITKIESGSPTTVSPVWDRGPRGFGKLGADWVRSVWFDDDGFH